MLSVKRYAWLCVLGTELIYLLCVGYGYFVSGRAKDLHNSLFELLPWFTWGDPVSIVWGGLLLGFGAFVGGSYIAWMHNRSLVSKK